MISVFKELSKERDVVYKKYDLYACKITSERSLYDFLTSQVARISDATRRLKTLLSGFMLDEPYWESSQRHSSEISYLLENGAEVCGSSLAEACERDKAIISFQSECFNVSKINIYKNATEDIVLDNLFDRGHCNELNWERNNICIKEYCVNRFEEGKLDFSQIDDKVGFDLLKEEDEELFIDTFRKFTELSWQQINVDDGLDYKFYPDKNNIFKAVPYKIHKFRVTQKYRCFGYTEDGVFYVLRFDLEHKLSD
ncbi:hypothetical protein SDC9_161721 [bioreactor metagenome]|uniref:Uncharacterized protein n=1 Tax=bioreactor metagenome TaxID=1076179 RepID=A0A645FQ76_9ZZZZ